jgi:hypothetical protein
VQGGGGAQEDGSEYQGVGEWGFITQRWWNYSRIEQRSPVSCGRLRNSFFSAFPAAGPPPYIATTGPQAS